MTRPSHRGIAACEAARSQLVEALLAVHRACDRVRGPNLPEALSLALGQAARRLGATDLEEAGTVLTERRPPAPAFSHRLSEAGGATVGRDTPSVASEVMAHRYRPYLAEANPPTVRWRLGELRCELGGCTA